MKEVEVYGDPKCGVAPRCGKGWEVWCRGCNLVFCKTHLPRAIHNCPSRDSRSQGADFTVVVPASEREGLGIAAALKNGAPSANGTVHDDQGNGRIKP